jgi:Tol biopolymer transport system component
MPVQLRVPSLFFYDSLYKVEDQITHFGAGIAYDPVWSPTSERIALVSDDSGNDEIWVINRDGSGALQLTWNNWEWDKHPSWSPDGSKIVFWSNRTGIFQIWVMDADGGNLYSLSRTGFNDWDPVWFKYSNVPG